VRDITNIDERDDHPNKSSITEDEIEVLHDEARGERLWKVEGGTWGRGQIRMGNSVGWIGRSYQTRLGGAASWQLTEYKREYKQIRSVKGRYLPPSYLSTHSFVQ
jgi:hypothetical protein